MLRHVKHKTGDYTYDIETGKWTKLDDNNPSNSINSNCSSSRMDSYLPMKNENEDEDHLSLRIVQHYPGNFIPELSSDNRIWDLARWFKDKE
ncbi:MAG: hypothetical protein ACRD8Z_02780 [Nitrososphaeraceae archaeon]